MTIKIQQCDRDRAAQCEESLHAFYGPAAAKKLADITRSGTRDNTIWVQEFAKHRIEAMESLQDPNVVHVNLLRGSIGRPTPAQIWHIYQRELLDAMPEEFRNAAHKGGKDE